MLTNANSPGQEVVVWESRLFEAKHNTLNFCGENVYKYADGDWRDGSAVESFHCCRGLRLGSQHTHGSSHPPGGLVPEKCKALLCAPHKLHSQDTHIYTQERAHTLKISK